MRGAQEEGKVEKIEGRSSVRREGDSPLALPWLQLCWSLIFLPLSAKAQPFQSYLSPQPTWDSFSQPDLHFY